MSRIVRTARGEEVDFDAIVIKQALAQAPMNIEVERRRDFIETKESSRRHQNVELTVDTKETTATQAVDEFDSIETPKQKKPKVEPIPNLPEKTS